MELQWQNAISSTQGQLPTQSASEMVDEISSFIGKLPALPEDALRRVIELLPKLTHEAQIATARLLAGKISHDFALRVLVMLSEGTTDVSSQPTALDLDDPDDQATIAELIHEWSAIMPRLFIQNLDGLRRVLSGAIGLQVMMEATSDASAKMSWVYDAGVQYYHALNYGGLLSPTKMSTEVPWQPLALQPQIKLMIPEKVTVHFVDVAP